MSKTNRSLITTVDLMKNRTSTRNPLQGKCHNQVRSVSKKGKQSERERKKILVVRSREEDKHTNIASQKIKKAARSLSLAVVVFPTVAKKEVLAELVTKSVLKSEKTEQTRLDSAA